MKCTITLQIAGESIQVQVDSSRLPNSLSELKEILGKERWKILVEKVDSTLKNRKKIDKPDLDKMRKSGHIIPNTTIGALMNRFPNVIFPEDSDQYNVSNIKVLFVDSYKTEKGELKYGLFTNPNGEQILIIDRYNLDSVAKYLQTMKSLKGDHILKNISPMIMDELKLLLQESKKYISNLTSVEDMLVNFLQNRSKYRDIMFSVNDKFIEKYKSESSYDLDDSINAYSYLDNLVGNLFNISSRKTYNDITINNISHNLSWNKNFDTASIGLDKLFMFLPNQLKDKIQSVLGEEQFSLEKFKEYFSGKINKEQLNNIFGNSEGNPYEILMKYLIEQEPEFAMNFKEVKKDRLYMSTYFQTLETQYGIGFEQLQQSNDPIYHNGRYIQQIIDKDGLSTYYVTKHFTDPNQRAKKFNTLEEAYQYIDYNLQEEIVKNSLIDFHKREQDKKGNLISDDDNLLKIRTKRKYSKGTLITVLDYDVPNISMNMFTPAELMFISEDYRNLDDKHKYATKEDFKNFVIQNLGFEEYSEGYSIILNNINTPEKIALFIMELNNPNVGNGKAFNKNSEAEIKKLAKKIGKVNKYRYYIVESSDGKTTKVLKVDNESKESIRKEPKKPVIQLWSAASEVLGKKLGIDIQILTEPEEGKENAKAYIKDNKVYINLQKANSEDLFHEYVHILMAYLKNTPEYRNRYRELINTIWNLGEKDLKREEIEKSEFYKNYSIEDKMEEYFVEKFGNWIKNNAKEDYRNIFSKSDIIKKGSSLFSSTTPISELYGSTIEQVFTKLNSDVAQFFKRNQPLMSSEYKDLFKASRQKSEWIRQQIKYGKLREYDCV